MKNDESPEAVGCTKAIDDLDKLTFLVVDKAGEEAEIEQIAKVFIEEGFKLADKEGYPKDLVLEYINLWIYRGTNCSGIHKQENTWKVKRLDKKFREQGVVTNGPKLNVEEGYLKLLDMANDLENQRKLKSDFAELVRKTVAQKYQAKKYQSKKHKDEMYNDCLELKARFKAAGLRSPREVGVLFQGGQKNFTLKSLERYWRGKS